MNTKKRMSLFLFSAMIFALPLFSTLSTASSNAMAIASIWADDKEANDQPKYGIISKQANTVSLQY